MREFSIDPRDCLLLLAFSEGGGTKSVAKALRKDASVVLRQLQRLHSEHGVVEKVQGKWGLTQKGQRLAEWAREAIELQNGALALPETLWIGAAAPFLERVFCPALSSRPLQALRREFSIRVKSPEDLETALLKGQLDIAFACGSPKDPEIRFRNAAFERWSLVGSDALFRPLRAQPPAELLRRLRELPFLKHEDQRGEESLGLPSGSLRVEMTFDRVQALRSAAIAGVGWALLPLYAVSREIDEGFLLDLSSRLPRPLPRSHYAIWWRARDRRSARAARDLEGWLSGVAL